MLGLHARQWMVVAILLGVCFSALSGGALTVAWAALTRPPTNAELQRAADAEVARRWRTWPAGRIFPERLAYALPGGRTEYAARVGVLPDTSCAGAADDQVGEVLRRHGCRAALRATYTDQLQGVVVTVGVVAFPDAWKADAALKEMPPSSAPDADRPVPVTPALHAVAFPGTASARFTDAARQQRFAGRAGPYVVLTAAGQADGRPAAAVTKRRPGSPFALAPQLAEEVARPLATRPLPDCAAKKEWQC
ncbi:hypothetical protein ACRB68_16040 [Actinomadura sp. RB68]|uniref:Uncharacterized protein n=1 Tax=Actinomadura macrotermitis TaxID=2585200 RepID=A0A7K0BQW0_9ACTN|nr:hypothetical protein [Actinomadura macrotermitis]